MYVESSGIQAWIGMFVLLAIGCFGMYWAWFRTEEMCAAYRKSLSKMPEQLPLRNVGLWLLDTRVWIWVIRIVVTFISLLGAVGLIALIVLPKN